MAKTRKSREWLDEDIDGAPRSRIPRGPGAAPVQIKSISLVGFRGFTSTTIEVRGASSGQWLVFLGPNGVGKSTFLRGAALALADIGSAMDWFNQMDRSGPVFVPPPWRSQLPHTAVRTSDGEGHAFSAPFAGLMNSSADRMGLAPLRDVVFDVFGFGSTRGTALGGHDRGVSFGRGETCATLFDPSARLLHAETWLRREKLRGTANGRFFDAILTTIASLLPGNESIEMKGDEFLVVTPTGLRFPFAAMSDGYLTTLGWTIDMIARWADRYRDTGKLDENFAKDMPCVVLVDELDLHLHPKWQLDIIPRLRAAFPKTTFVVTTHNPLTLQGTQPGEVFVMNKDDDTGEVSIAQRDVPPGTDANRLLTGDWFGLGSTLDESTLKLLDAHRAMLLAHRPEADLERRALEAKLRMRLNGFADTSYERMALDVIAQLHDEKMRQRRDITDEDRERVVREVRARLAALDAPATSAREPLPTFRPTKAKTKATPKPRTSKPSAAKKKPAARTKPR